MTEAEVTARRVRRHGETLEGALLDAAWSVLVERSYAGFSYEAIAERAGTSRPVLYRRWPTRDELLLATLRVHWRPIPVPDTGSLRGDAVGFLKDLVAARAQLVALLSIQLAGYFDDAGRSLGQIREALRDGDESGPFTTIVERAVSRGEIPERPRSNRMISLPFDLIRHEMLMTRRPVTDETIVQTVDELWRPLLRAD